MKKNVFFILIVFILIFAISGALYSKYYKSNKISSYSYDDKISINKLDSLIKNKKSAVVYFYSPNCVHCEETSPILIPLAKKLNIDLKEFNILKYDSGWGKYKVSGTPTIIFYKNGAEVKRLIGSHSQEEMQQWLTDVKKSINKT
jgi:thioredoxin 1